MSARRFIPISEPIIGDLELAYVTDAVRSGWVSSIGPYVERFEAALAARCTTRRAVSVSNGTTGLQLALTALGVGPGDEVIVPDFTFVASASSVIHAGARPVLADVDRGNWCLDPADVERRITPRTRAIMPVHLFGQPSEMSGIMQVARQHGLFVVEDAAQALGATFQGQPTGSVGDIGVFSFFGNKVITTGEGGMLVTNNEGLADRARFLRDHAQDAEKRYFHPEVGFNFRLTNLQAALGVAQMEQVDGFLARKREIDARYRAALGELPGLVFQRPVAATLSSAWLFTMVVEPAFGLERDALVAGLREGSIDARTSYYPIHEMPPYLDATQFPVSDWLSRQGISLPSAASLTLEDQDYVIDSIKALARPAGVSATKVVAAR